jgi:hypothetical protein
LHPLVWLSPVWLSLTLVCALWLFAPESDRHLQDIDYQVPLALSDATPITPNFVENALARGLSFEHRQNTGGLSSFIDTLGGGVCVLDANSDGWMDLFLVGGSGTRRHFGRPAWWADEAANRLFINQAGVFFDQTKEITPETSDLASMGCAVTDLNQDQIPDILLFGEGGLGVYESDEGKYRYRVLQKLDQNTIVTGATALDVNRDGRMDLYVTTLVNYRPGKNVFEQFSGFAQADISFRPELYDATPNLLLINQGDLEFDDQTKRYGVGNAQGRSMGASALDLNQDGWLDLVVLNDFGTPNRVYLNQQGEVFIDGIERYQSLSLAGSRSLIRYSNGLVFTRGQGLNSAALFPPGSEGGEFEDASRQAGFGTPLMMAMSSWGGVNGDFNSDGIDDLVLANGHLSPDKDAPLSSSGQPNRLMLGRDASRFADRGLAASDQHYSSRGIATADFDNDGDLDLVVANNNGRFLYYDNQTSNAWKSNWISFELETEDSALPFVEVSVQSESSVPNVQKASLRQGFLSQSDKRVHFVLPAGVREVSVQVTYSNGLTLGDKLPVNQIYIASEALGFKLRLAQKPDPSFDFTALTDEEQSYSARIVAFTRDPEAIELFWPVATAAAKIMLLNQLSPDRDAATARLVQLGLDSDESDSVQLAAVGLARKAELDWSVDWLLPLLAAPDEVSCAVASLFVHFFDEEEIAIRRKGISIKALLKRAEAGERSKGQLSASVCAIDAVAASENKRALPLLKELVMSDAEVEIQAAAVRALGLLRDTSSESLLRERFQASSSPKLLASIVIALTRLGYSDLIDSQIAEKPIETQLALVAVVADSEDAAVVGQSRLSSVIRRLQLASKGEGNERLLLMALAANSDRNLAQFGRDAKQKDSFEYLRFMADQKRALPDTFLQLPVNDIERMLELEPQLVVSADQWIVLNDMGINADLLATKLITMPRPVLSKVMQRLAEKPDQNFDRWLEVCARAPGAPLEVNSARTLMDRVTANRSGLQCALYGASRDSRRLIANRILIREFEKVNGGPDPALRVLLSSFDEFYAVDPKSLALALRSSYLASASDFEPELLESWWLDGRSNRALKLQVLSELVRLDKVGGMEKLRELL